MHRVVACVFAFGRGMAAGGDPSTVEPRQAASPVIAAVGDIARKSLPSDHERRKAAQDRWFGVLRMVLGDGEYSFEFVTAPGEREFTDAGGGECV